MTLALYIELHFYFFQTVSNSSTYHKLMPLTTLVATHPGSSSWFSGDQQAKF